jgi:4-hydroxyphenylacetate 3-monooxygenase
VEYFFACARTGRAREDAMVKDGRTHVESLRDGRRIFIDGRCVDDHTRHPAFRNAVAAAAGLYDYQAQPDHLEKMTFVSPTSGDRVSRMWQLPTSYAELVQRRQALEAWAELTCGMLGRSPDHVASCISAMRMGIDLFERHDPRRAAAVRDYYEYARDRDLYLTYVIISPQADRSKAASEQADEFLVAGVCDEDREGITIRGAKMLGTACPLANEVFVGAIQPLKPGEEKYSLTAMVPLNAKGLKILSRKSFEAHAGASFDNPLSSRFDENDAVLYFEDVKVPWERVFVHNDVALAQAQWHAIPTHVFQNYQCQIRLAVKLRFLLGLAGKIAETNGIAGFPQVRDTLGQLAAETAMVEGMLVGMEASGSHYGSYYVPNRKLLYSAMVLTQQLYPKFVVTLRELSGGGMIMLPSSIEDFGNAEIAAHIEQTQRSPVTDAVGRVKLFKLAWDAVGSEFGSRHLQYEMFYAGATMVTRAHAFRTYDWERAVGLVDTLMASYDSPKPATVHVSR